MPQEEDFRFTFVSIGLPEDTFIVAEFKGVEGVSMLYEFEIILSAHDPELDLKEVLKNPATLTVVGQDDEERKIHGIPSLFEQLHELENLAYYRLKLVPRLWLADQYHENMLFLEKSVPEIIEEILKQVGLTSQDYELKLTGSYHPWEYICQYNETDFAFISRWMEREGIFYYFDQSGDIEKLIVADSSTVHQPIEGGTVLYSPPERPTATLFEQITEFTCRTQILPKKVILKDYNYRKPSMDLKGEADVDSEGRGNVYIYGEHFKTPEEGNALAKIRAEELICRETLFLGGGTVSPFLPGFIFELDEHYRDSYNQKYLITETTHHGKDIDYIPRRDLNLTSFDESDVSYKNQFTCIPEAVQFRPARKTSKPRIDGTLNAKVDAAGDGQYAEIDDEGRYKIKLPFDQSDASDGKASRWVRMAQPYAGADYGMHFPLHKGTEVLLTFVDGDPDRPIVAGSVPNPETGSPVKGGNQSQSMIRTGGGNQIRIEDNDGGQQIHMSSPTKGSIISLGAVNEGNIFLRSDGTWVSDIGDDAIERIAGDKRTDITGVEEKRVTGNQGTRVGGNQFLTVARDRRVRITGKEDKKIAGDSWCKYEGAKAKMTIGLTEDIFVGAKLAQNLSASTEITAGVKHATLAGYEVVLNASGKLEKNAAAKIAKFASKKEEVGDYSMESATEIDLDAGLNITVKSGTKIILDAPEIELKGKVTITEKLTAKDEVAISKDCKITENLSAANFKANK